MIANETAKYISDSSSNRASKAGRAMPGKAGFAVKKMGKPDKSHQEKALDEALVESFPASDPVAVSVTKIQKSLDK